MNAPLTMCGPQVHARLHNLTGEAVEIVTLRMRYCGTLLAVHQRAIWLEVGDDCHIAITEPVVTVARCTHAAAGGSAHAHPAVQAS